jgi:hypothetical protein
MAKILNILELETLEYVAPFEEQKRILVSSPFSVECKCRSQELGISMHSATF